LFWANRQKDAIKEFNREQAKDAKIVEKSFLPYVHTLHKFCGLRVRF
jgi:hypothetical protein